MATLTVKTSPTYHLELSQDEAEALRVLLGDTRGGTSELVNINMALVGHVRYATEKFRLIQPAVLQRYAGL